MPSFLGFSFGFIPVSDTNASSEITGSGTVNTVAKFTAGQVIGNSTITDTGSLVTISNLVTITEPVKTSGSPTGFLFTGGAHTTLATGAEAIDINFNLKRTVQFATGAITTQRAFFIQAPVYGFVGASIITNAATFTVEGPPVAGTNATITNTWALWVQTGNSCFTGGIFTNGTGGSGFVDLGTQSSAAAAGAVKSVRLYSDNNGDWAYIQKNDGFIRTHTGVLTGNRSFIWPDYSGQVGVALILNNFRLTLSSGTPVTTTDVTYAGAQTIFCTPYTGNQITLYDGTNWLTYQSAQFSLALGSPTTALGYDIFCYANASVPTIEFLAWTSSTARATALVYQNGILVKNGDATRRYLGSFYSPGNKNATVTMTIAAPCVVTYTAHALPPNAPIVFTTDGALPTGIVAGTTYYVASVGAITANTFNISSTPGGALITTTGSQSGTHTGTIPAYTEDSQINRFLFNYYNAVTRLMYQTDATTSYTYTTAAVRVANANLSNLINFFVGVAEKPVAIDVVMLHANSSASILASTLIGIDSQSAGPNNNTAKSNLQGGANCQQTHNMQYSAVLPVGLHYAAPLEFSTASGTCTWFGTSMAITGGIVA